MLLSSHLFLIISTLQGHRMVHGVKGLAAKLTTTLFLSLGRTLWKERPDFLRLSSDVHMIKESHEDTHISTQKINT